MSHLFERRIPYYQGIPWNSFGTKMEVILYGLPKKITKGILLVLIWFQGYLSRSLRGKTVGICHKNVQN